MLLTAFVKHSTKFIPVASEAALAFQREVIQARILAKSEKQQEFQLRYLVRVGAVHYNTLDEIQKLKEALEKISAG